MADLLSNANRHPTMIGFFSNTVKYTKWLDVPVPADAETFKVALDVSGSMGGGNKHAQSKVVLGTLMAGTHAEGKFDVPKPGGGTNMIDCSAEMNRQDPTSRTVIIGDGDENGCRGVIRVGTDPDTGDAIEEDMSKVGYGTKEYRDAVAKHLKYEHGADLLYVGLGSGAQATAEAMATAGVAAVRIDTDASDEQIVATMAAGIRRTRAPRAERPTAPILHTSDEVNSIVAQIPAAQMASIQQTAGKIHLEGEAMTKEQTMEALDAAIKGCKNPVKDDYIKHARTQILFLGKLNGDVAAPLPGATLLGQHCGLFKEPEHSGLRKCVNQSLSKLSPKTGTKAFSTAGNTPDGGLELEVDGRKLKFAKGCMQYNCHLRPEVIDELLADRSYTVDITEFEKTTNASPKKRGREGPELTQPTRGSPGADSNVQDMDEAAAPAAADPGVAAVETAAAAAQACVEA